MNGYRLTTIAAHEARTLLRGPLFWALVVFIGLATVSLNPGALIPSADTGSDGARLFVNSAFVAAESFALVSFFLYNFFAAIMAGFCVIRDEDDGITEILHATPLTRAEYLTGKMSGVMAALSVALVLHTCILIWFAQLAPAWNAEAARGPFELSNFVGPALAFALPGIWFSAALAFAVGIATRRPLAVLAVPTTLFLLTVFVFNATPLNGLGPLAEKALMIADPSGLRWLRQTVFAADRGIHFYNTAPIPYDGVFALCRAVTVVIPLLVVLSAARGYHPIESGKRVRWRLFRRFSRRRKVERRSGATESRPAPPAIGNLGIKTLPLPTLSNLGMQTRPPGPIASMLRILRAELTELRAQPAAWVLGGLVILLLIDSAMSFQSAGAPVLLSSGLLATGTVGILTFLTCLLILFVTVESFQREQSTGFGPILYSSPIETRSLLLGKALSGFTAAILVLAVCLIVGTILVSFLGERVDAGPFLFVWGGIVIPTLFFWQAFVAATLAFARGRAMAYAMGLVVLGLSFFAALTGSATWITNWPLVGALRWSDMGAFELHRTPLLLNRILVTGMAVFLLALAIRSFPRMLPDPARSRRRLRSGLLIRRAVSLSPYAVVPLAAAAVLAWGIRTGYEGDPAADRALEYRRTHLPVWRNVVAPSRIHVDLRVDVHPRDRSADIAGTYTILNPGADPMTRLPFTLLRSTEPVSWSVDGQPVDGRQNSGLYVLPLDAPLDPEDSIRVGFEYRIRIPDGFSRGGGGADQFILPSGVVLHTLRDDFLPIPGFVDSIARSSDESVQRASSGSELPPDEPLPPAVGDATPFTTRIHVSAPETYTINSVGTLVREHVDNGRRFVEWCSDVPVRALNIAVGRWKVRRDGGAVVYHHPAHDANIDEMVSVLSAARSRYSEWFGPYPWPELRLNEIPNVAPIAQGFPSNITFSEGLGFTTRPGVETGPVFTITAHEAAHQWWGNMLTPGDAPGSDVLIEGMANYATLLLYGAERGDGERRRFALDLEERYVSGRRVDTERPLAESVDDGSPGSGTVVFDKGAWVLWMLHDLLGADRMIDGLTTFIERGGTPDIHDFIAELRPASADSAAYDRFVDQWFFDVILPEYRVSDAVVSESNDGWVVTATVQNNGSGRMPVRLAAVTDHAESVDDGTSDPGLERPVAAGEAVRFEWTVDHLPRAVMLDPEVNVLQSRRPGAIPLTRD